MGNFQTEFKGVTRGSDLLLRWEADATASYPLVVYSRLINQTSEFGANSLEINITTGLNTTSFLWKNVPYPLPYLATALYEVEVRPQNQAGQKSAIASSSYFAVSPDSDEDKNADGPTNPSNGTTILPSRPTIQPVAKGGVDNNTAIAAGLVVPVFVILAIFGFVWLQRRQKKIIEEKRKQREELYID
ncbi:hypothetical protein F4811DRAFT_549209 [Daldinia bambusicola]|nr:hypothetical protein F4811DRAFT_549209 [Daldinia bambusicola]